VIPEDLRYTAEHEWVRSGEGTAQPGARSTTQSGARSTTVRVGITHYAQDALGDVVFVSLPEVGAAVTSGESCGEVESTKSVSEVYAPLTGEVTARNEALTSRPELINSDPYGEGWLVEITVADLAAVDALLDAKGYADLTGAS
jgi:glycine cleavage system H protein